jgi:hypothetical protein
MRVIAASIAIVTIGSLSPLRAQETYPPMGKLVDIDGRRLHVHCTGAGGPTVILESGASSFAIDWALVQPAVARTNRVCSYDRPGYGWSDPAPYDLRGDEAVRVLHVALDAASRRQRFRSRDPLVPARPRDPGDSRCLSGCPHASGLIIRAS